MNQHFRIVSSFIFLAAAMFVFTSSAYAALPGSGPARTNIAPVRTRSAPTRSPTVTFKNGTSDTHTIGMRFFQPYGKHAQPMMQRRDAQGRWMKPVALGKERYAALTSAARLRAK